MFWVRFRSAVVLVIITLAALIVGNYLLSKLIDFKKDSYEKSSK